MDVNGTKYHLLYGCNDWGTCLSKDGKTPLAQLWRAHSDSALEWDDATASLRLTRKLPLFRRAGRMTPLDIRARRGASRDAYGNWYWIDADEHSLRFLPNGAYQSVQFWTSTDLAARCTPTDAAEFATPCVTPTPPVLLLRGLAVTTRHFLVVGDVTERGLLLFDLHRGGAPMLLRWQDDVPFEPWDIAPTPDGGVLVLDRSNLMYWALDSDFRLLADVAPDREAMFQPADPQSPRNLAHGAVHTSGYALEDDSPPGGRSPVSIEPGPNGTVLILDTDVQGDPPRDYSIVYVYQGATQLAEFSLQDAVEVVDPSVGEGEPQYFSVVGQDFAFVPTLPSSAALAKELIPPCDQPCTPPVPPSSSPAPATKQLIPGLGCSDAAAGDSGTSGAPAQSGILYIAERDGKQAIAFVLGEPTQPPIPRPDLLPMRRWDGKALVAADGKAYYDFADRWVQLEALYECHYVGRAVFTTPLPPTSTSAEDTVQVPGAPFDSQQPGCVWHRLLLDAQIPAGTAIQVRVRAADSPQLIEQTGWKKQPDLYRRSGGAEIAFYDPWSADSKPLFADTGTWELLFQDIVGRFLQLELTVLGTGRSTPALRALRAWYPRFSYLKNYLPAVYSEDATSASFMDRWLANFEGLYTNLEDKIEHAAELFDPTTAPAEALDWLACWFGVALDPLWQEGRRRFFIHNADKLFRIRGTVPGVEIALRLYIDQVFGDSLFDLACLGQGKVRIVEWWMTRGVGGLIYGDPTDTGVRELRALTSDDVMKNAHRFTVLIPHDLSDEQLAMAERIVNLEKPAHTDFQLKRYWDLFRVGEARLGLDTRLGEGSSFSPLQLGASYLPDVYLAARYPFDISDRIVSDRDRLGDLPSL